MSDGRDSTRELCRMLDHAVLLVELVPLLRKMLAAWHHINCTRDENHPQCDFCDIEALLARVDS